METVRTQVDTDIVLNGTSNAINETQESAKLLTEENPELKILSKLREELEEIINSDTIFTTKTINNRDWDFNKAIRVGMNECIELWKISIEENIPALELKQIEWSSDQYDNLSIKISSREEWLFVETIFSDEEIDITSFNKEELGKLIIKLLPNNLWKLRDANEIRKPKDTIN